MVIDSIGGPFPNSMWRRIWPVYLLAPVVLFLLLQTLWRVFAAPSTSVVETGRQSRDLEE